jgi:hypothetical protein
VTEMSRVRVCSCSCQMISVYMVLCLAVVLFVVKVDMADPIDIFLCKR